MNIVAHCLRGVVRGSSATDGTQQERQPMSTNPYMVRLPGSRRRLRHGARAKTSGRPTRSMRERLLMPVLFAPVFMVILDVFIVNVAAPSLRTDLHATASEVQWVVGAYVLTYAISLVTAGRLG